MTLTELRYIIAVAREKHFGRAAEACFVSQPTLSVAIKKIESQLGILLFERGIADVSVTPIGQAIIEQAQVVLEEAAKLKSIAEGGKNQLKGVFRLGAIYTIGPYIFPLLIPRLLKLAPEMPIEIQEGFTGDLRKKLRQGEIDAGLVALPFTEPGIVTFPLYEEPLYVLLPQKHPWNNKKQIAPELLAEENLLLLGEEHCLRTHILEICAKCNISNTANGKISTTTIEGSSLETIRHMVASGMGISVLPSTAISLDHYKKGILQTRPFTKPVPYRRIGLAWRNSFPRTKAIDIICQGLLSSPLHEVKLINT